MSIDTTGLQELILTILTAIANFDIKTLDFDYLGVVLTAIAPVWNPIWAAVNEWLNANFGF